MPTETILIATAYVLFAVAIGGGIIIVSAFLGPRVRKRGKLEPYESGMPPLTPARERINTKFYLYAILFVIFDVETAFLILWAVVFRKMKAAGAGELMLAEGIIFLAVLGFGLVYLFWRGALSWEEGLRSRDGDEKEKQTSSTDPTEGA